ncbi:tautomerase family protein [Micromonospora sp. CPCC 206060]|uniref:tautomerase family protein n=1 Tax=Micromonospora sp. CPCC 206060 TaxID=3122406 RepID=UPI002FF1CF38
MPKIQLTVPQGALTPEGRAGIQNELAMILLRWEGAPDTEFVRSIAWSYLHELPPGAQITAQDDQPRFLVEATVPAGALSERRKAGLVADATAAVLGAAGLTEAEAIRVWVLIHEQPEGTWGAAGRIFRREDIVALARQSVTGG